ncbi:MAG: hypothetical protein ACK4EX_05510 [Thermaurantimonas sp.]|uniref:DUF3299 domain-containing protein n=1 Tax=Thermaurantimonas aggregans TaxID=2173829 RepID=UPI000F586AEB|nr:DUF3299 domain-containing protein [Thermaurantimonas aggregans]MCX8147732.1 hypothetical protein [Thermaurantimonas aggregans]
MKIPLLIPYFRNALTVLALLIVQLGHSQKILTWFTLGTTLSGEDPARPGFYQPIFSPELEKYNGQEVILTGYVIPVDFSNNTYALSKTPFANCFFCGKAGIETVVGLRFKNRQSKFLVDQFIVVKGILRLNKHPNGDFIYYLENAELHG